MIHVKVWRLWENTSFCCSIEQAEARRPLLRADDHLPPCSLSSLASSSPRGTLLRCQSMLDVSQGFCHHTSPPQGYTTLACHLFPRQTKLSAPFDPHLLHKNSMQFKDVHQLPCPSSCSQSQAHTKTLPGVVNFLMTWRPTNGSL